MKALHSFSFPWRRVLALFFAFLVCTALWAEATQAQLAEKVIRLHVLANSDSQADQTLKLQVRDRILEQAGDLFTAGATPDEAAEILRGLCQGPNMKASAPKEGKIELTAGCDGLFLVDTERLRAVNALGDMMIATRFAGFPVKTGDKLCGTRVIPLVVDEKKLDEADRAADSSDVRYSGDEVFKRARGRIHGRKAL